MKRSAFPFASSMTLGLGIGLGLALTVGGVAVLRAGQDAAPVAFAATRYDAMAERSPFTAPTAPIAISAPAPAPAGPHWWDSLGLSLVFQRGDGYLVTVFDRPSGKHYLLETGKEDAESHMTLASVQWADKPDGTTVTVRRGSEVSPALSFDPVTAGAPAIPGSAPRGGGTAREAVGNPTANPVGQPFHPPGQPTFNSPPAQTGNSVVRRPPIAARPPTIPGNSALNRPSTVQSGNPLVRRPVKPGTDDDDDDD